MHDTIVFLSLMAKARVWKLGSVFWNRIHSVGGLTTQKKRITLAVSVYDLDVVTCIVNGYDETETMTVWEVVDRTRRGK